MHKKAILAVVVIVLVGIVLYLNYAYGIAQQRVSPGSIVNLIPTPQKTSESTEPVEYEIVEVARGLHVPWSLVFTSADRILVAERNGNIRAVLNRNVSEPLIHLNEVVEESESGLMGMALHPNYSSNKYVYACLTYRGNSGLTDKVERFKDNGESLSRDKIIMDNIPAARNHAGCRIKFGPDGKLYITSGDAQTKTLPQDLNSLGGKILRINDDGTIPSDNPFGTAIWSYGHRNPQGISWNADGVMYETEHGPSGNDGPGGGDEVNHIKKGANYGWPVISHNKTQSGMENAKLVFTPAEAPSGATFYSGKVFPQFKNNFFFAALRGNGIFRVVLDESAENVVSYEKLDIKLGRIREIAEGPDGLIYFTTSNTDGRGRPATGDDKIYRFEPK